MQVLKTLPPRSAEILAKKEESRCGGPNQSQYESRMIAINPLNW